MIPYEEVLTDALDKIDQGDFSRGIILAYYSLGSASDQLRDLIKKLIDSVALSQCDADIMMDETLKLLMRCRREGELAGANHLLAELINSGKDFIFHKLLNGTIYHWFFLTEISLCESSNGRRELAWNTYESVEAFAGVYDELRFAVRRIWLSGTTGCEEHLLSLIKAYRVSAEMVAVAALRSVWERRQQETLYRIEQILRDHEMGDMAAAIDRFADHGEDLDQKPFASFLPEKEETLPCCDVINLDMSNLGEYDTEAETIPDPFGVSYILCASSQRYADEVLWYLKRQVLAKDYKLSVYIVWGAKSMAEGYNAGMRISPAKYKIYIHQDLFVGDPGYTMRLIHTFQKTDFQMLGVAGTSHMPPTGCWWEGEDNRGCLYLDRVLSVANQRSNPGQECVAEAEGLDGVLLATSTDLSWREDLPIGFHMYDASQVTEFIRNGYRVGIFSTPMPCVLHEEKPPGDVRDEPYENAKRIFTSEYFR